jgi:PAS domain S-box-containing protein
MQGKDRRQWQFGIFPRLMMVFIFFATALLACIGYIAANNQRSALQKATIAELTTQNVDKQNAMLQWMNTKLNTIIDMASVRDHALHVQELQGSAEKAAQAREYLREHFNPWVKTAILFLKVSIVDIKSGMILVSTNEGDEGKYVEDQPFFINGKNKPFIQAISISLQTRIPTLMVSAPMYAADGEPAALLTGETGLDELNKLIGFRSGLRLTDDAFLVNSTNLVVTQPHLKPGAVVLRTGFQTLAVNSCLQHNSGSMLADDYRGIPAIIVYHWLAGQQLCLITKVDQAEAFAPADQFTRNLIWMEVLVLLAASLAAYYISRVVTRPILELKENAERIRKGDYSSRQGGKARNEIGQLAESFQQMAGSIEQKDKLLRQHAGTLEKEVAQRTAELSKTNRSLQDEMETHKKADEQISFQASLLANVYDAVIAIDKDFRITFYNAAAENLFGWKVEDAMGQVTRNLFKTEYLGIDREEVMQIMAKKGSWRGEIMRLRKDGARIPLEVTSVMLKDISGNSIGMLGVMRDISERRRAEAEIHALNTGLEMKVRERTAELAASNQELEAFAYSVSHDLRAPLRAMSGFSEALAGNYPQTLDEHGRHYLDRIQRAAREMGQLIDELLNLSRVTRQEMKRENVNLSEMARSVADELLSQNPKYKIEIEIEDHLDAKGDAHLLRIVLENLIGNAFKFSNKDENAKISIGKLERDHTTAYYIMDNGVGFDMTYADKLFTPFQRLHNKEEFPGTGIGLASVKRIITRHGGQVWAEAKVNEGATFFFTLGSES